MTNYKKFFLVNILLTLTVILVQLNFLNLIFSEKSAPNLILMTVIASVVAIGLDKSWGIIITLGIMLDLMQSQIIGLSALIFIFIGVIINFFSRLFVFDGIYSGKAVIVLVIIIATVTDSLLFSDRQINMAIGQSLVWKFILNAICFYVAHFILKKMNKFLV